MSTKDSISSKENKGGFGFQPRLKRRLKIVSRPGDPSDADLIRDFIAKKGITICAPSYADGAIPTSGEYDF